MKIKKNHLLFSIIFFALLLTAAFLPHFSLAQINANLIDSAAGGAGYPKTAGDDTNLPQTVGRLISIILSFVGALFFIFIIVSGLQWMTAGGSEEKVEKAKTRIINASLGLAVTMVAYFITWFISNVLLGTI